MSKHTPGPWTFSGFDQFGETRFYVSQQEGAPYTPNYSDVASLIAETVSSERIAIQRANAKLIAAAPELLAALQECLDHGCMTGSEWVVNQAREAIAKATGE